MSIKLTIDAAHWQNEVNKAVKTLEKLTYYFEREQRQILEYAALPMVQAMQQGAPVGTKIHARYSSHYGARRQKGSGKIRAYYYPGNLQAAFSVLDLKKTTAVIVGARVAKKTMRHRGGMFGKSKYDAYYLSWVEFGTRNMAARPFVRPAIVRASPAVIRRVQIACNLFASKFARQNAG